MPDGIGLTDAAQRDGSPPPGQAAPTGVLDELSGLVGSVRATLSSVVDLVTLEAHRALLTLMWMAVWTVVAAICIVSAWLALMAALVLWAISFGVSTATAVLGIAAINGAVGAWLIYLSVRMSRNLLFSATRRQLAGKPSVMPLAP